MLLNDLGVPVKRYISDYGGEGKGEGGPQDKDLGITLEFYRYDVVYKKIKNKIEPGILVLFWQAPLPLGQSIQLIRRYHGALNDSTRAYFGKQIVNKIDYVHYNFKK